MHFRKCSAVLVTIVAKMYENHLNQVVHGVLPTLCPGSKYTVRLRKISQSPYDCERVPTTSKDLCESVRLRRISESPYDCERLLGICLKRLPRSSARGRHPYGQSGGRRASGCRSHGQQSSRHVLFFAGTVMGPRGAGNIEVQCWSRL